MRASTKTTRRMDFAKFSSKMEICMRAISGLINSMDSVPTFTVISSALTLGSGKVDCTLVGESLSSRMAPKLRFHGLKEGQERRGEFCMPTVMCTKERWGGWAEMGRVSTSEQTGRRLKDYSGMGCWYLRAVRAWAGDEDGW